MNNSQEEQIIEQLLFAYLRENSTLPSIQINNEELSAEYLANKYVKDKAVIKINYGFADINTKKLLIKLVIDDLDMVFDIFKCQSISVNKVTIRMLIEHYQDDIDKIYLIIKELLLNSYTDKTVINHLGCSKELQDKVDSMVTMYSLGGK